MAMQRKYLAFDIEIAAEMPDDQFDWRQHRPVGICCAATLAQGEKQARLWYGKADNGAPAGRMSAQEAAALVEHLVAMQAAGYTPVTWNGLGFDFDVLSEESAEADACRRLALEQVDMMFHVFCLLGFPVGLEAAAAGMKINGKLAGMNGAMAPQLWAAGKHRQVLDYVAQDVRMTLNLANTCDQQKRFRWVTRSGKRRMIDLPKGWLSVAEAQRLPEVDNSWMKQPLRRSRFLSWVS